MLRFEHRAGEKCFIDYAGQTVEIIDRHTGELRPAQIFVAVLGCSNYTSERQAGEVTFEEEDHWIAKNATRLAMLSGVVESLCLSRPASFRA